MTQPETRARRRLEQDAGRSRLPVGCMAWGGVLGIIVGIMVALYALPPILRSIYGEKDVAYGEVYEESGKRIEVLAVDRTGETFSVRLDVRSNQLWTTVPGDWQLEISTQDDWLPALPPEPAIPETSLDLPMGESRTLLLRFPAPTRVDARPVTLHISDPRIGIALRPE